jgi:hypothetical protein
MQKKEVMKTRVAVSQTQKILSHHVPNVNGYYGMQKLGNLGQA